MRARLRPWRHAHGGAAPRPLQPPNHCTFTVRLCRIEARARIVFDPCAYAMRHVAKTRDAPHARRRRRDRRAKTVAKNYKIQVARFRARVCAPRRQVVVLRAPPAARKTTACSLHSLHFQKTQVVVLRASPAARRQTACVFWVVNSSLTLAPRRQAVFLRASPAARKQTACVFWVVNSSLTLAPRRQAPRTLRRRGQRHWLGCTTRGRVCLHVLAIARVD
jgi:hypothetical protein